MSKTVLQESHHVMSNAENNNNKFWRIFMYEDFSCRVEFGRVGDSGQSKDHPHSSEHSAKAFFDKKCKEKLGKGYKKIEILSNASPAKTIAPNGDLTEVAKKQISTTSSEVQKLIEYFSKVNIHTILESTTMKYNVDSGLFSTPIGIVTKDTVDKARDVLNLMLPYVKANNLKSPDYIKNLEDYLMLIPKNIGRRFNPESIFSCESDLTAQSAILDSLEASIQSVLSTPVVDSDEEVVEEKKIFNVKVEILDDDKEFKRINDFFLSTKLNSHVSSRYKLKKVYKIEIEHMHRAYNERGSKLGNVMELWHGTKASNILSILKGGLVMPNPRSSHFTGSMFGLGAYFSDQSSKSLNYSCGYWDNKRDNNPFMFIADVAMGKAFTPSGPRSDLPLKGYDSTFAVGGKSGVQNNEMIVYKLEQCNLKYLCEFE